MCLRLLNKPRPPPPTLIIHLGENHVNRSLSLIHQNSFTRYSEKLPQKTTFTPPGDDSLTYHNSLRVQYTAAQLGSWLQQLLTGIIGGFTWYLCVASIKHTCELHGSMNTTTTYYPRDQRAARRG